MILSVGRSATEALVEDGATIRSSDRYRHARATLGESFRTAFYLDIASALEFAAALMTTPDSTCQSDVEPWLRPLSQVISGTKRDGDYLLRRFVLGFR